MSNKKLFRITTVPRSLDKLLEGQLSFMSDYYEVTAISSDAEYLKKIGEKEKVAVFEVDMSRKITPFADLRAIAKLYFYLKKTKPFIVHTHTPKAGMVGMMAAKLAGVPHRLHTVAGLPLLEAKGKKRQLLDFVEKITYAAATKVFPNSFGLRDIIKSNQYCPSEKLKVLANGSSNGINTQYFNPEIFQSTASTLKDTLGIHPNDFVFIFVGRLVKDKGINELVDAFDRLIATHPNTKLVLVGKYEQDLDPLEEKTLGMIASNKNIISTGYQSDVRPYFAISDALVFPSYREGFPNVVMQAGAMNLPCIVTNINGCNEIVRENDNGLIIPVHDALAIFNAMKKMMDDKEPFEKMRQNARPRIVSQYEQQVVWKAILDEYQDLT